MSSISTGLLQSGACLTTFFLEIFNDHQGQSLGAYQSPKSQKQPTRSNYLHPFPYSARMRPVFERSIFSCNYPHLLWHLLQKAYNISPESIERKLPTLEACGLWQLTHDSIFPGALGSLTTIQKGIKLQFMGILPHFFVAGNTKIPGRPSQKRKVVRRVGIMTYRTFSCGSRSVHVLLFSPLYLDVIMT